MKKLTIILCIAIAIPLCGCGTIAERLADALEPHLERLVDQQIEREEKASGVWGTTNSFFYAEAQAAKAEAEAEAQAKREDILSAVSELIAANQDKLVAEAERLVEKKLGGK